MDFQVYLKNSFMSLANDEKWSLKGPTWPRTLARMTSWCSNVPVNGRGYSYGPYWIVLFSSLWREPCSSSYWQSTEGMEQELATVERVSNKQLQCALSQGNHTSQKLRSSLRWHRSCLLDGNPHLIGYSVNIINSQVVMKNLRKAFMRITRNYPIDLRNYV